jgi:hypothetical protein
MTNREFYQDIINFLNGNDIAHSDTELIEHANGEIEKLNQRNEKRANTPSKAQKENAELLPRVTAFLNEQTAAVTAEDVGLALDITTGKASSLLRGLVAASVVTVEDVKIGKSKRKAYAIVKGE